MNKLIVALAGVAGLTISLNASAAAIANNTAGSTTTIDSTACALLDESIKINLSKSVAAGYACNTSTNVIAVATCHPNGRKPDGTNNFIYVGSSGGGSVIAPTPDTICNASGSAAQGKADAAAAIVPGSGT